MKFSINKLMYVLIILFSVGISVAKKMNSNEVYGAALQEINQVFDSQIEGMEISSNQDGKLAIESIRLNDGTILVGEEIQDRIKEKRIEAAMGKPGV